MDNDANGGGVAIEPTPLLAPWMADWVETRGHWGVVPDDLVRGIPFRFEADVDEYIAKAIRANAQAHVFAAFAGTVRRFVRFMTCVFHGLPYYGYDDGCDYCAMCPRAVSLGHCDRGERMGYKQCGTTEIESNDGGDAHGNR